MTPVLRVLALVAVALTAAGCGAHHSSIFRSYETVDGQKTESVVIDAKQRAILAAPARDIPPDLHRRTRDVIVCAEPSPDALSAISSTFAGSFGGAFGPSSKAEAALATAFTETASQLGTRNATIQLLRDGLYRQCEAYMNGLIERQYYEQIANKYANAMVTLLAIEELTLDKAKSAAIRAGEGAQVSANTEVNVTSPTPGPAEAAPPAGEGAEAAGEGATDTATADARAPAPTVNVNLPDESTAVPNHVSAAVNTMVTWFLTKDTVDYCLRGLFSGATGGDETLKEAFIDVCKKIIIEQMAQQRVVATAGAITAAGGTFGEDACTAAIEEFWMPDGEFSQERFDEINAAMQELGISESLPLLLSAKELADKRARLGTRLGLEACQ